VHQERIAARSEKENTMTDQLDVEREREAFEAWAISEEFSVMKFSDGSYQTDLQRYWQGWLAARRASVAAETNPIERAIEILQGFIALGNPFQPVLSRPDAGTGDVVGPSQELRETVKPRPLAYSLDDYWTAPSGKGPLAFTWIDKPHRLLYDLIAALLAAPSPAPSVSEKPAVVPPVVEPTTAQRDPLSGCGRRGGSCICDGDECRKDATTPASVGGPDLSKLTRYEPFPVTRYDHDGNAYERPGMREYQFGEYVQLGHVRTLLATKPAHGEQPVQDFVLVPVEPTEAMMDAAEACSDDWPRTTWKKAWAAMLNAVQPSQDAPASVDRDAVLEEVAVVLSNLNDHRSPKSCAFLIRSMKGTSKAAGEGEAS
jgi:hypothetical protein